MNYNENESAYYSFYICKLNIHIHLIRRRTINLLKSYERIISMEDYKSWKIPYFFEITFQKSFTRGMYILLSR